MQWQTGSVKVSKHDSANSRGGRAQWGTDRDKKPGHLWRHVLLGRIVFRAQREAEGAQVLHAGELLLGLAGIVPGNDLHRSGVQICQSCHEAGSESHPDGCQAGGRLPVAALIASADGLDPSILSLPGSTKRDCHK